MENCILLKPFAGEKDDDREYDILRGLILATELSKKTEKMTKKQRKNFFHYLRRDSKKISELKKKYPVINEKQVKKIAIENQAQFFFWIQNNTREKPKIVTNFGNDGLIINFKISGFEDYNTLSFKKLILMLDIDADIDPYKSLRNKIKKFPSIAAAVNYFGEKNYSEEEFFEAWGDYEIRFRDEKTFGKFFSIGFSIWSDDLTCTKLLGSWSKEHIPIIMKKDAYYKRKFRIFDEITCVIDKNYLKEFKCQYCHAKSTSKRNLERHEKTCQNGATYRYEEKQYGGNLKTVQQNLQDDGILPLDDDSYKRFISFDIESLSCPVSIVLETYQIFYGPDHISSADASIRFL